jgi:hypothetical protein
MGERDHADRCTHGGCAEDMHDNVEYRRGTRQQSQPCSMQLRDLPRTGELAGSEMRL